MLEALAAAEAAVEIAEKDATDLLAESMTARGRQPNLSFFAFTATPKPKTLELFGEPILGPDGSERFVPFHLYSMRQAIEEGFILDVLANYTTYDTYYRLANTEPSEDPEVPIGKAAAALARFVSLHPTNLAQKAEIIVEHFRPKTAREDRRARQGDGGHPVPAARGALQAGHRRLHHQEGLRPDRPGDPGAGGVLRHRDRPDCPRRSPTPRR